MPIYLYRCPSCLTKRDIFKPLSLLNRSELCESCKTEMERQLCPTAIVADYAGYSCPVTGQWIEGRRAHQENLKRHGCRVLESGETDQVRRARAAEESALDREVDSTVEQFFETLPTEKKAQLAAEVSSGLDVSLVRN